MPAPLPTPSGVIRIAHNVAGIISRYCMHYAGSDPSTADLATVAAAARVAWGETLKGVTSSGYSLVQTTVADLANPDTPDGVDSTEVTGTESGTPLPVSCPMLINFGVDRKYRGSKPKIWLPIGVEGDTESPKSWSTAFVADVLSIWNAYIALVDGTTAGPITVGSQASVSYFGPPTIETPATDRRRFMSTVRDPPKVLDVTSVSPRLTIGSQRRRLLGT